MILTHIYDDLVCFFLLDYILVQVGYYGPLMGEPLVLLQAADTKGYPEGGRRSFHVSEQEVSRFLI